MDRAKWYLNTTSDRQLSLKLGKFDQYISQCRERNTIDYEIVLRACYNADFNWLLTGDLKKTTELCIQDEHGKRVISKRSDIDNSSLVDDINYLRTALTETQKQLHETQKMLFAFQKKEQASKQGR